MTSKRKLGCGLSLAVVAGLVAVVVWELSQDKYVVERWRIGQGREIILYGERSWEAGQPVYYVARDKEHPHMQPVPFCIAGNGQKPDVTVAVSPTGSMAAVVSGKRPWVILALHDFRTGEDSLVDGASSTWDLSARRDSNLARSLLDRFTAECPKRGYRYPDPEWDALYSDPLH